jgi:hypothetical protein
MDRRQTLIEKLRQVGLPSPGRPLPVVSLEDFFVGNEDYGSIGCNLSEHPGPRFFFEKLMEVRARPGVQDVLVEINEVEESDESMWPFSDRVYVLTSAAKEEVEGWVAALMPDEVEEGFGYGAPPASAPGLGKGVKVYGVWWD